MRGFLTMIILMTITLLVLVSNTPVSDSSGWAKGRLSIDVVEILFDDLAPDRNEGTGIVICDIAEVSAVAAVNW